METINSQLFNLLFEKAFMYRENPPFKLASGQESHYYFNCKTVTLDPQGINLIAQVILEKYTSLFINENTQAIGGLTLGADPISLATSMLAYQKGITINPLIVRKEPKKHGTQKWIEGHLENVKNVIVIDDVITTGGSTILAIERMKESGLQVKKALVLIDREEGGKKNIEDLGLEVLSLFKKTDFDQKRLDQNN